MTRADGPRPVHRSARTVVIAAVALVAVAGPVQAQEGIGSTATLVLQIAPAPRPLALGGTYAALAADELGIFYNPARLSVAAGTAGLAYQSFPADIGAGSLAAAFALGPGVAGAGVHFVDLGEIDVVEPDPLAGGQRGRPTGERVGAGEVSVSIGYGFALGPVQLGASGKVLRVQLADATGTGAAFDVGAALELLEGRAVLAVVAQNLGPSFGPGRPAPLPRTFRAGAALRLGAVEGRRALLTVEAIARHGRIAPAVGVEGGITAPGGLEVVGRIGYDGRPRAVDVTAPIVLGGGITVGSVALDYAFRALGPLGGTHQFGLSLNDMR